MAQHEDMLELLHNARLEVIENAGHFDPLEQAETVTHIVADFLTGSQT
ncbi:MAG: alpha/beta fold hydrolase [Granulosicoccus sp.]